MLNSFDESCRQLSKRKKVDSAEEGEMRQPSLHEAFAPKPPKAKLKIFTQDEFDNYIVNYVIDSVLPLQHVDCEAFTILMRNVAPGNKFLPDFWFLLIFNVIDRLQNNVPSDFVITHSTKIY